MATVVDTIVVVERFPPTVADTRYNWRPQAVVHAEKRREAVARGEIAVGE